MTEIEDEFIEYIMKLDDESWKVKVNDNWTVKDVVVHLVGWERECAKVLPDVWRARQHPWFMRTSEYDRFNAKNVFEFANFSSQEIVEEWGKWRHKLDNEIAVIGEQNLRNNIELFEWVFDEGHDNHTLEHLVQIKKALNNNG